MNFLGKMNYGGRDGATVAHASGSERYVGESEDLRFMGLLFLIDEK
jgi:hypothetical protein